MNSRLIDGARYAFVWKLASMCLGAIGVGAAVVFVPPATVLMIFLVVAGVVGSVHLSVALGVETLSRTLAAEVVKWAVRAGLATLAVCGYVASVGLSAFVLVLLVAAASPPAVRRLSQQGFLGGASPATDVTTLSDEELCRLWQRSFSAVRDGQEGARLQSAIEERQRCLDELERRRPEAFARWLDAMPVAAGDPSRYYLAAAEPDPPERD
ncbi:hypothetical protein [Kribbella sp. CA-247076]|uniref:hypothetical protein n=1 Tax=Kribbella sp. CA-247076 TaxID=3239941 RepID=UPI003D938612